MSATNNSIRHQIVPGLSAGLVIGVVDVIYAISLAALIFAGDASQYVANGIGLILLGGIPPLLLINLFSSYKGNLSCGQDAPTAILAVMAAGVMQNMPSSSSREKFITIVALIVFTTLLTGILFILLGQFKLGSLVRFLPYPVIGGFLAGTGWLLVTGGIGVMADLSFSFTDLGTLFQPGLLLRWVPGLGFAFIMLLILNRYNHFMILPGMFIGTVVLFYGIAFFTQTPVSILSAQGWLLGPFSNTNLFQPLHFSDMALVNWNSILAQSAGIASVLMISVVTLLLNASGIELIVRQDIDLNRELRVTGLGNIIGGLMGGIVSFHDLTDTVINHKIGKGSRLSSWVTAAVFILPFFFGAAILTYVPKITLGVMLILFGFSFLYEWIYLAWFNFSRVEYVIILLILITIATLGFLQGVGLGIVAALGLFTINYSRVSITKHTLSGAELQSRFTRSPNQRKILMEQGDKTFILQLEGFIFFGTANKLLEQVRSRIEQPDLTPLRFLILDFAKVSGLDSTAMLSFSKMKRVLQDRNITILVAGSSAEIKNQLEQGKFVSMDSDGARAFPDLDHGLEWVENNILAAVSGENLEQPLGLKEIFNELLPNEAYLNVLFKFLERKEIKTGDYLMHQEDAPDNIYFIESGQVTAQSEYPNKASVRLETMKSGRVIGELGFYLGQKRTAAVIADEPSTVYTLSAKSLVEMEKTSPEVASYFHQLIIQLLAERTTHLIRAVNALEK
jgi:SulP family sulfate permease